MLKQAMAIGTLLSGGAGMGFIVYLQVHPLAFTSPADSTRTVAVIARTAPAADPLPTAVATDLALPLEQVRATAPKRAPKPAKAAGPELSPCTTWREVGATYLVDGRGSEARSVRGLCGER
jgi:hypothetical protein